MARLNFKVCLVVVLSIGVFAFAGFAKAAENDAAYQAIMEGAKQMMDANKKIMDTMEKKGMKDADLVAADKLMSEGYETIQKGRDTLATNNAQAREMASRGGKMMLEAQKKVAAAVEKKGMVEECKIDLSECTYGEKKIKEGALQWFFGSPGL